MIPWSSTARRPSSGTARLAVTGVSFPEAQAYATWTGGRLPTVAEWIWAAAWGSGHETAYPWGDEWESRRVTVGKGPQPVGTSDGDVTAHKPQGVQDLAGGVCEWASSVDPAAPAWSCGGCYASTEPRENCRANQPDPLETAIRSPYLGFRTVRSAQAEGPR